MTPSNYAHTNNSILTGDQHKVENAMTSKLAVQSKPQSKKRTERSYEKQQENTSMTHVESQPETRMQPKPLQFGSSQNPETFNQRSTVFAQADKE